MILPVEDDPVNLLLLLKLNSVHTCIIFLNIKQGICNLGTPQTYEKYWFRAYLKRF